MPTSTSLAAYRALPEKPILAKVLDAIEAAGERGLINDEIAEITGIEYRTVTPRITTLEGSAQVYRAGDKRPGRSGSLQLVTRAVEHKATIPLTRKVKVDAFTKGMIFAANLLLKECDLGSAKHLLGAAIRRKVMTP